ncbi:MAG: hypothetical protein ACM3PC_06245, partial [Deltaproteobacteria bacterium]
MAGRRWRMLIGGALVAVVLGLPAVWRMRGRRPPVPSGQSVESDGGSAEDRSPPPAADANRLAIVRGDAGLRADAGAADPRSDAEAWRNAPMAFGLRELGGMGPYVKAGLDAARRDMDFCFQQEAPPG